MEPSRESSQEPAPEPNHEPSHNPTGEPTQVPFIRYGVENKKIPGDSTGWKMKECGNIAHWGDIERYNDFPPFGETDFEMRVDPRITTVREFLSGITSLEAKLRRHGQCIRDLPEESVIDGEVEGFEVRLIKLHDVSYRDKSSYKKATRSKKVEKLGADKMAAAEPPMGRDIENYLMAVRMSLGEAPPIPKHRATTEKPEGSDNRKHWYRDMRRDACRTFWVKTTREQRDGVRARAKAPDPAFVPLIEQIQDEDKSHTKDPFWPYQRDEIAAEDANIYEPIDKDILIVLDKDNELLVCCFKRLFQFLFCQYKVNKLEDALRKWSSLPPLPLPETNRHMIDDFIRDTKHPEMDLERATSLEEIEQRQQCVVHYGTWAMKGHRNPDMVWKTVDTKLQRATPAKVQEDIVSPLMPTFTEDVLGLGSEPIRFLLSSMAPDEYRDNCDVFQALPENVKMKMSEPTFASLAVLGINTYTARHSDTNDVTFGLAGLLALGNYCGGNLCFPQLALQTRYQRGDVAIFRGAELEHFVRDWSGYRVFLLYTNHQPVRNYVYRRMGKLPPKPNDNWHPDRVQARQDGRKVPYLESETNSEVYDPCWADPLEPEPEELWDADIHGAGYFDTPSPSSQSGSDSTSASRVSVSRGRLIAPLPPRDGEAQPKAAETWKTKSFE